MIKLNQKEMELPEGKRFKTKEEVRKAVWEYLERKNLVSFPRPCFGRIPNFIGVERAVQNLNQLVEWQQARVIFSAPDAVLIIARSEALKQGRTLLVAAPNLTGFYLIKNVPAAKARRAATIKGLAQFGQKVAIEQTLPKVDLYLTGAVACDLQGNRIGKGTGYGDREDEILSQAGLIDKDTPRVAIIHEAQLFPDLSYLVDDWDTKVSIIITQESIYRIDKVISSTS